ncbi:mechanosensitive ion channel family protein [Putridiphycobacter roseus]|uniref:Mechanosensing system component YbdG n=1 Tax=Putridiphycobacter roseus TaxID=2219161 RepID=A0A2W1NRS2_9FLAO|nr:mechanosensitive ion channel domain-containing protein [Putridiphycobacter roseus]PZE18332.1 mechanosensitive ion channel family protein [Putridiphycobacter roseus]
MQKLKEFPISDFIIKFLNNWLGEIGLSDKWIDLGRTGILLVGVGLLIMLLWWLTRKVLINILHVLVNKSKTKWDDYLVKHKFFAVIANLVPLLFMDHFIYTVFYSYPRINTFLIKMTDLGIVIVVLFGILRFLSAASEVLSTKEKLRDKPIHSYFQLSKILAGGFMVILGLSILTGNSPLYFLTGLGAATAILLLIFKDTILGFVGSIQLAANDMVRIGDWITMEKYGADGDVVEINLATVKIQNFDKTITTIPTYSFISDSFKNWRGMEMSDGRRIKRAINIEINSIKFADSKLLSSLKQVDLLGGFIEEKESELADFNAKSIKDPNILVNGRRQTNIGLYRRYITSYLEGLDDINHEMTLMVRQLAPTELGVPVEIYCFSKNKEWEVYEEIVADIFDHLFATTKYFELSVFERPTGKSFSNELLN